MEQIITDRCLGLYRNDRGEVRKCERAIGHMPECGPDSQFRPYVEPPAQTEAPAPDSTAGKSVALRVMDVIRDSPHIYPTTSGTWITWAALWDATGQPVSPETLARILHVVPGTVDRHLKACPVADRVRGRGWRAVL